MTIAEYMEDEMAELRTEILEEGREEGGDSEVSVKSERTMLFSSDFRCVRLDVYASDEAEVSYNIEMQNQDRGDLAKRSRYHQAEMDIVSLKPGESFGDLKPCYVIFICTFDPFADGKYCYTFENR